MSSDLPHIETTIIAAVHDALAQAEKFYACKFPIGKILFNLKGRAAGQVRFPVNSFQGALPEMRFNLLLLNENFDEFLKEVVPHECAHLVVYRLYSLKALKLRSRPKPHGIEWKSVMHNVYGLKPRVTHSFDVQKLDTKRFNYCCGCDDKTHHLSLIRHNKIQRQVSNYLCRGCGEALKPFQVSVEQ